VSKPPEAELPNSESDEPLQLPQERGAEDDDLDAGPEAFISHGLTDEQRRAVEGFAVALETAGPDFGQAVSELKASVAQADVIAVMGVMAMYLGSAEAGTNPEHDRPLGMFQHHLELAQAALLRDGVAEGLQPPWRHVPGIADAVKRYNEAWIVLQAQKVQRAAEGQRRDLERLMFELRVHASSRRGWAYRSRMVPMLTELLNPLTALTEFKLGFAPAALITWWTAMLDRIDERLDRHRAAVRDAYDWEVDESWSDRIAERFGRLTEPQLGWWAAAASTDGEIRRFYVTQCSDLCAHEIFRFTIDELVELLPVSVEPATVKRILDAWSMSPGDDGGAGMQHLPLENPVVNRPFVRSGKESWHLFCGWLLLHNPFELLERLLKGDEESFGHYMDRRSEFLEERVAQLLARALPGAAVERSLLSIDPVDGREYENDVVAFVSTFSVVAEAKAGRLHPDARRGHSRVLRHRVDELLVKPSEQGLRLADRLEREHGELHFTRKADGSILALNAGDIRRTLTIAVTLEPIAGLLPRLSEVSEAGLSERQADALAYNISLPDLELVVDLLDHPSEVLHYLGRRTEIERRTFLTGDEVDLLALYLQTGFNIGEREFSGRDMLDVTGLSDPIDTWHYRREAGLEANKPRADRTAWWEAVLTRIEQRGGPRWAEIGVTVCNVAPPDQHDFEQALHELRRSVLAGERPPTDVVVFHNGPPQRRNIFAGVIAVSRQRAERERQYQAAAASIVAEYGAQRVTIMAWTPRPIALPYFALSLYDDS
jgi:hypothetical protein